MKPLPTTSVRDVPFSDLNDPMAVLLVGVHYHDVAQGRNHTILHDESFMVRGPSLLLHAATVTALFADASQSQDALGGVAVGTKKRRW